MNQWQEDNYIFPFLWIHGETEETYIRMVHAIYDSNIRAFCVEARPHKEFLREQWWNDLEIILSEAEKLSMRVWILDDKHFPTGYANGGVEKAPKELHRWHICRRNIPVKSGKTLSLNTSKYLTPKNNYDLMSLLMLFLGNNHRIPKKQKDDILLSCSAYSDTEYVNLEKYLKNEQLSFKVPEGNWSIEILSISRNTGMHRNYINMIDSKSCKILIDEVYESHYKKFKEQFGNTIAGFFSDEPELGNGNYIKHYNYLGTEQSLPYSDELAFELQYTMGEGWKNKLPLLWNNGFSKDETAKVRYQYMDCVSRLVEKNFSKQIGEWCNKHSVEYIGHIIEDNNQHARTSTSLGHYFRGLKYQNMAGIDNIGGQVQPGGEDYKEKFVLGYINDGEFYHYGLGKLGTSLGAINPRMKGRTMCEIFGNYGWKSGVRLQKYLIDHFMVRGVNRFVPHAFNSKEYPDKDCPPHFYAHGNNPQYRHFGILMEYTNRICELISDGMIVTKVAILYHGESEWSGNYMLMQKPARVLLDNQIDFNFIPSDVFSEKEFYKTEIGKKLVINEREHELFLIPYSQYITYEVAEGIVSLLEKGGKVIFLEQLPDRIVTGEELPKEIAKCNVIQLEELVGYIESLKLKEITLNPSDKRIRVMHYKGNREFIYLFHEGSEKYDGQVRLILTQNVIGYDPWRNKYFNLNQLEGWIDVTLEPSKSLILFLDDELAQKNIEEKNIDDRRIYKDMEKIKLTSFKQSICKSIDYPMFTKSRDITELESYHNTDSKFSGYIRYETWVEINKIKNIVLEITDAYEGVEVFVNEVSAGIQVVPKFQFDVTELCREGKNHIVIEVATTLERERGNIKKANPTGITGEVNLYTIV